MYKLLKPIKETSHTITHYKKGETFNAVRVELYDEDNRLPYGRNGGTNFTNTNFRCLSLQMYRSHHSWYNTDKKVSDLIISFGMQESYLKGGEKWIEYNEAKLIEIVEEMFQTYMDNIFRYLGDDIKTDGKKRFWSEKGDVYTITGNKDIENNTHQSYDFVIVKCNFDATGVYRKDTNKRSGKIPLKRFKTINKDDVIKMVKPGFLEVANWFLSQEFDKSLIIPSTSDIISLSREEAQKLFDDNVYGDKTNLRQVIK